MKILAGLGVVLSASFTVGCSTTEGSVSRPPPEGMVSPVRGEVSDAGEFDMTASVMFYVSSVEPTRVEWTIDAIPRPDDPGYLAGTFPLTAEAMRAAMGGDTVAIANHSLAYPLGNGMAFRPIDGMRVTVMAPSEVRLEFDLGSAVSYDGTQAIGSSANAWAEGIFTRGCMLLEGDGRVSHDPAFSSDACQSALVETDAASLMPETP